MKRRLFKLALLLLLGAVINIAVTWSYSTDTSHDPEWLLDTELLLRLEAEHAIRTGQVGASRSSSMRLLEIRGKCEDQPCLVQHVVTGWPMFALTGAKVGQIVPSDPHSLLSARTVWAYGTDDWDTKIFANTAQILPLCPVFSGFAINTLLYAAICWLLFMAPFALRRRLRRRRGRCTACAYPIGTSEVCTECGQPLRK